MPRAAMSCSSRCRSWRAPSRLLSRIHLGDRRYAHVEGVHLRVRLELVSAGLGAEVVRPPFELGRRRRLGFLDLHATNRIDGHVGKLSPDATCASLAMAAPRSKRAAGVSAAGLVPTTGTTRRPSR